MFKQGGASFRGDGPVEIALRVKGEGGAGGVAPAQAEGPGEPDLAEEAMCLEKGSDQFEDLIAMVVGAGGHGGGVGAVIDADQDVGATL